MYSPVTHYLSIHPLHSPGGASPGSLSAKNILWLSTRNSPAPKWAYLKHDGTMAYTRDGSFKMSVNRELVTANGEPLQPSIVIPQDAESISIGEDGVVTVQPYGNAQETTVGQIQLARFVNYAGLEPAGRNLYRETAASGQALVVNPTEDGAGALAQGALEAANVNVVEEMVNMIETQRAYEINSKAISSVDSMLRFLNQNL